MTAAAPIRLAVVAPAKHSGKTLAALRRLAGDRIDHVVHLGGRDSDYKASSFFRMNAVRGTRGHLMEDDRFTGAAAALETGPDMAAAQIEAIDHLMRGSDQNAYRDHGLRDFHDYQHAAHIALDALGGMLIREHITHVLFFDVPHLFYDTCLYHAARARGLPTLIVAQSHFGAEFFAFANPWDLGTIRPRAGDAAATPHPIPPGEMPDLAYMRGVEQAPAEGGHLRAAGIGHMLAHHLMRRPWALANPVYMTRLIGRMRRISGALPSRRDPFARFFHTDQLAYFDYLAEADLAPADLRVPFVYFPLHMQPEMTTATLGGRYRDQLLALERLAGMLPADHRIYVKENPKQTGQMRSPMFFHRLNRIAQARLVPSHTDSAALIRAARAVATITGTAGWEALLNGKPALTFGAAWYRGCPGVTPYRPGLQFDEVAGQTVDHAAVERFAGLLRHRAFPGVVNRHNARPEYGGEPENNADLVAGTLLGLLEGRLHPSFDPAKDAA